VVGGSNGAISGSIKFKSSWKISKEYISEMVCPSHFDEIERMFAGIWERIMCEE